MKPSWAHAVLLVAGDHPWARQGWSLHVQTRRGWEEMRGSQLPTKRDCPQPQPAAAVRAPTLIKSRPILGLFPPRMSDFRRLQQLLQTVTQLEPTAGALAGNETSVAFLSHFWRSPAPFLFLFRTRTMCRAHIQMHIAPVSWRFVHC